MNQNGLPCDVFAGLGRAGGSLDEPIGQLLRSEPICGIDEVTMDASVIQPDPGVKLGRRVRTGNAVRRIRDIDCEPVGTEVIVYKRGATQNHLTSGLLAVKSVDADITCRIGLHKHETTTRAYFDGYWIEGTDPHAFARDGDSGSIVVDEYDRLVGMVVAVTGDGNAPGDRAFCIPIARVLDALNVDP